MNHLLLESKVHIEHDCSERHLCSCARLRKGDSVRDLVLFMNFHFVTFYS